MISPESVTVESHGPAPPNDNAVTQQSSLGKKSRSSPSRAPRDPSPTYAERVDSFTDQTDLFMTLEPPLCGQGLPSEESLQRAQLQIMYLEIIGCNTLENGEYMRWYFTARQSMATRGVESVYLRDDRSDQARFLEARKHQYALTHSLDAGLRSRLWPHVPLLRLAPSAFFQLLQHPSREILRSSARIPAILAFQQLERGRNETMTQFLQRAVALYFTMAYVPLEMWFQMPLAMLANQIMLAHRKHYTFAILIAQNELDEKMTKWKSGHDMRALVSYFIQKASIFTVSG